jgi:curli production assembly/transport component CsgG
MNKTLLTLAIVSLLSGCAITHNMRAEKETPVVTQSMMQKEFDMIPAPATGKSVSVAVYSFQDKTGQRRPIANIASLSTAVTQGGESFLIKALQDVGRGQWFDVVERVGIDNLTKERTIIRQMREAYEGPNAKPLMPMQFAGMIIEGGIIGYDSSTKSGGSGARWLGIGATTQYSEDIVTVSLRAVSVQTGKVLISVTVQKTILSSADSITALKFFDAGTKAFEGEIGMTINEPGTYAVKSAVEAAVVEMIKEGQRKGVWSFKEEKKDELVQPQTPQTSVPPPAPAAPMVEPSKPESNGAGKTVEPEAKQETVAPEAKSDAIPPAPKIEIKEVFPVPAKIEIKEVFPPASVVAQYPSTPVKTDDGKRYLKDDSFVYKEPNEKSQRTWLLKKGVELTILSPGPEGWYFVIDAEKRKGFVMETLLTTDKPKSK